jgi:Arc/MetJ-type ribon-helix-helix transcriptional regulator
MSEIPLEGPEISLDQVEALGALEKAFEAALSQVPPPLVLARLMAMFPKAMSPKTVVELDSDAPGRFHGRVQKVSVSMPEDLAAAIRERTGSGAFSRFVAEAAERQLKSEEFRELLDELAAEAGPIPAELEEQVTREWLRFYEEE